MVTQTLTKPAEGDTIYARKATGGATATATWEALVDMCNELAGRSGQIVLENSIKTPGTMTIAQTTAPTAPGANYVVIYAKSDGAIYYKTGTSDLEQTLGGAGFAKSFLMNGV